MISPILFTLQIILLVLGLGIGYLILVKANNKEDDLKNIGKTIGWALIVATIILEVLSFAYSMIIVNQYAKPQYCPVNATSTTEQQYTREVGVPGTNQENEDNAQEPEMEGRPVKNQDTNTIP